MSAIVARPLVAPRQTVPSPPISAVAPVRLMMLMLLIAAGVGAILVRLAVLAFLSPPAARVDLTAALVPLRGDLVDRNGQPLAQTIDAWSIGIHPDKLLSDPRVLAPRLAGLMPEHDAEWYLKLLRSRVRFAYLARRALPELVHAVNALGEPAMAFERVPERLYPQSALAAHVLGSLDIDGRGVRGMEGALDTRLSDPAARARPLALSIDARVQAALESELGQAVASFQAHSAAGVILDANTGEVIAMTSFPNYDPNRIPRVFDARNPEDPGMRALRNNVTQSVYELGSTFKPITFAAAIDAGVVPSMARRYDATAPLMIGRYPIHDDHPQKRWLDVPEALIYSSNIVTARIAREMGAARMQAAFRSLGFDRSPDIELPGRGRPIWPDRWSEARVMTSGFGHGVAVTPLHLASAYAALVNGGTWHPATMMKLAPGQVPAGRRVFSEATSARMRQLLRLVVLKGTGEKSDVPGYRVGGKTGTAEIATKTGYSHSRNVSTFAAAFPIDSPRYVVVAMLDSPIGNAQSAGQATAGWTVAPVVGRVITRAGSLLGVTPDLNRDVDVSDLLPLIWQAPDKQPGAAR